MIEIIMNPWVIGIGCGVFGGLILYYIFGVGRKAEEEPRRVGVLNKGRNNRFTNNTFINLDIGIKDEGEGTVAQRNKFMNSDYEYRNKVGNGKNHASGHGLLSKYWWGLMVPLVVLILGYIITEGKVPQVFNSDGTERAGALATTTPNLSTVLGKANSYETSLDQQNFLRKYKDTLIYGNGAFLDIAESGENYMVNISVSEEVVTCVFSKDSERRLLLLRKSQSMDFYGIFTSGKAFGGGWYITDCAFEN